MVLACAVCRLQVLVNLHPDKVQQRGGTVEQRYIADQVFAVLREANVAFLAGREFSGGGGGGMAGATVVL